METILKIIVYNLAFWTIVGVIIFQGVRSVINGFFYIQTLHRIPCARCAFFTKNYCLKCTVHPHNALTIDAIGCRDYEPSNRTLSGSG